MTLGRIQPLGLRAPFWLPANGRVVQSPLLTTDAVESVGGRVVGRATRIGFFARTLPASHLCAKCKVLITKL